MTEVPEKPRASRNDRQGELFGKLARLGIILAVLVTVAGFSFYGLVRKLEQSPPIHPDYVKKPEPPAPDTSSEAAQPAVLIQGIPDIEQKRPLVEAALRIFFKAGAVDDKLAASRHPERVRPLMMSYYQTRPLRPRELKAVGTCQSVNEKGHRLGYVQAVFTEGSPVSVIVEEAEDGSFKVDWESLVRYSEMEWSDFLTRRPREPVLMRVIASRVENGPGAKGGKKADAAVRLEVTSPGQGKPVWISLTPDTPGLASIQEQLDLGGGKNVPLTLRLCYSEPKLNADGDCGIAGVEGKGWLILN